MSETITVGDNEYVVDHVPDEVKARIRDLRHVEDRLANKIRLLSVLTRSKNSCIKSLKDEIIAEKSGFLIEE